MLGYRLGGHAETLPSTCVTLEEKAKISYSTWPSLPHSWIRKALSHPCFCFQSHFAPTHPTKTISIFCYIILMLQSLKVVYEGEGSYGIHNLTVAPTHTPSSDRQRRRCQRSELTCFLVQCLWDGEVGLQTRTASQTLQPPVPLLLSTLLAALSVSFLPDLQGHAEFLYCHSSASLVHYSQERKPIL